MVRKWAVHTRPTPFAAPAMTPDETEIDPSQLGPRMAALPALGRLRELAAQSPLYLAGGAVRDLLLGRERLDLDVVVQGDAVALASRLDPRPRTHERFGTATVRLDGLTVDLAAARSEAYAQPGALPEVRSAGLAEDLGRRDFTINSMAVPLVGEPDLIDPYGGLADLRDRVLRVLHESSFVDDPTRALRAARYAARFGLAPSARTGALLRAADLASVSAERVEAELRRLALEPDPLAAMRLLVDWALVEADLELAAAALEVLRAPAWRTESGRADAFLAGARPRAAGYAFPAEAQRAARELAREHPERPSAGERAARGRSGLVLVLARAMGAQWLDDYVATWRDVRLELGGADLIDAGIEQGPAVGRGLEAALAAKLDGEVHGRDEELSLALDVAGGARPEAGA